MATETDSLLWLMGEWAIKGTFLIAFVGVLTLLLKNASAALRHGMWAIGMVMLLCLPLLQVAVPAMPVGWLPAPQVETAEPAAAAIEGFMPTFEASPTAAGTRVQAEESGVIARRCRQLHLLSVPQLAGRRRWHGRHPSRLRSGLY